MPLSTEPTIDAARARAYRIPADRPEADGSLARDATPLVVAEIDAGPVTGLGYTYADAGAVQLDDWRSQRVRACKIKIGEHDAARPGLGLAFRRADAERFAV